jgi:hypothetical protein
LVLPALNEFHLCSVSSELAHLILIPQVPSNSCATDCSAEDHRCVLVKLDTCNIAGGSFKNESRILILKTPENDSFLGVCCYKYVLGRSDRGADEGVGVV